MLTLGIFSDRPRAATGFAVVNSNLAQQLTMLFHNKLRTIYFARFKVKTGISSLPSAYEGYEVVGCEGGVWKPEIVREAIERYKVDIAYSEDDWWSARGLVQGTKQTNTPFYFMTPIDSLPIQREGYEIFRECRKVFVPNKAYNYIPNGVYLPHTVDWMTFRPVRRKAFKNFTFLWIGRDEIRKNLRALVRAYEIVRKKYDCNLVVRSNWGAFKHNVALIRYINGRKIPILKDKMTNCPHSYLAKVYSACDAFISTSRAGACEMGIKEAQACGLPVLVTDWTYMCENVVHRKNGFLIPIEGYHFCDKLYPDEEGGNRGRGRIWGNISVVKLTEKMIWMLEHQKKAWKMGMWGMENIRKEYTWEDIAEVFYKIVIEDYETFNK